MKITLTDCLCRDCQDDLAEKVFNLVAIVVTAFGLMAFWLKMFEWGLR